MSIDLCDGHATLGRNDSGNSGPISLHGKHPGKISGLAIAGRADGMFNFGVVM